MGPGENLKGAWANLYRNPALLGRRRPETSNPPKHLLLRADSPDSQQEDTVILSLVLELVEGHQKPQRTARHKGPVAEHPLMEAEGSFLGSA